MCQSNDEFEFCYVRLPRHQNLRCLTSISYGLHGAYQCNKRLQDARQPKCLLGSCSAITAHLRKGKHHAPIRHDLRSWSGCISGTIWMCCLRNATPFWCLCGTTSGCSKPGYRYSWMGIFQPLPSWTSVVNQ